MYDRSEAAVRRIAARARGGGEIGRTYVALAFLLMRSAPASPSRDRALKRLADSCEDAVPRLEKTTQSAQIHPPDTPASGQLAR